MDPACHAVLLLSMLSRGNDQPSALYQPSPLFSRLLDRAFAHYADATPTVLRVRFDGRGSGWAGFPSWPARQVAATTEIPSAAAELLSAGPLLLLPPWQRRDDARGAISREEHELVLMDCVPPRPESLLAAVVPASTMVSRGSERFRRTLASHWRPVLVLYAQGVLQGVHEQTVIATVFLRPRANDDAPPLRMFKCSARDDESAVLDDFEQLLARNDGRGQFGYVLRDAPELGTGLGFARHDPRLNARRDALSGFGGAATLEEVFETPTPGYHVVANRDLLCGPEQPGAVRVISGRDLKRDGTIGLPDERTEWATVPQDQQLRVGDILLQKMIPPSDLRPCLAAAEVVDADLPAAANSNVAVLRSLPVVDPPQRILILQYLRSPLARELIAADGTATITLDTLRELPIPQPDEALSTALTDLAEALRGFESWRAEAEAVLQTAFPDNEGFQAARARLVKHGRTSRLRLEAASNLDDHGYMVRTRFPYPVAYRWRTVEAERSAGVSRDAYDAVLETAEVLLCYTAHLALLLARDFNAQIGYSSTIRSTFARGKGLGFGDWTAILEEVRDSKAFRNLPDAHPLNDVRSLLASPEASTARRRLNDRRNDDSHLRKVDPTDLPHAIESAFTDLTALLRAADFLSDLSLIHVTAARWDNIRGQGTMSYRELMGDHPVAPTRTMPYHEPGLEVDSLYLVDGQHRLHLLRPFLIGRICPTCRNWSTFHVDGIKQDVVILKSLEHGHTTDDASLIEPLRHIGLLRPLVE